jgi:hypothetical protein
MRLQLFACAVFAFGCDNFTKFIEPIEDGTSHDMAGCSSAPDLTPPAAKCAAATGLAGDNLICVDFASIPDQSLDDQSRLPAQLARWDFVTKCGGKYWVISSQMLQIKSFSAFNDTCGFLMPSINFNDADKQKYQKLTLSIVQKMDLDPGTISPNQAAQVYFGNALPAYLVTQTTGTQPEQQITLTIDKQKLPLAINNTVKYLLQVQSGQPQNKQGWQIESIAVMATQ